MRLFIGIDIPEDIKEQIVKIYRFVKSNGKFVEYENLHITLLFLGEINDNKLQEIKSKMDNIEYNKFEISLKGLNTFGDRILFIEILKNKEKLIELANIVQKIFNVYEDYYPHITIQRIKYINNNKDFLEFLNKYRDYEFGEFIVDKIYLKKSTLTNRGPIYENIYSKDLL